MAASRDATGSSSEFVKALTLTDATMLVAGSMIGFVVIQTGTIAAVAVAFGRFLGVLWPAITPDRLAWFPQADVCLAAMGCTDPAQAIQLGLTPQRLIALISVWVLTLINLRGVREGKTVQTSLTVIKTGALALLIADETRVQAISGLVVVLFGVPAYFLWRRTATA